MVAVAWWQGLLGGLGHVLAWLYSLIPSYAVAIVLLTVGIRLLLLPLGIKQIRSMHAMASLQPKIKAIQQKYKGNRQKQQEEMQRLYQEAGVNPLAGCLPMLLQLPVLIALYAVLRFPANVGAYVPEPHAAVPNSHIPVHSRLYDDIVHQTGGVKIGGFNWLCAAGQAGKEVPLQDRNGKRLSGHEGEKLADLDCGHGAPIRIPYYLLIALMVGTTYYQQRQMQKANPSGQANQQQQILTRIMPIMFGFWGWIFPSGLVLYWTTSNLWQIGQQHFMLRAKEKEEEAIATGKVQPKAPRRSRFAEWMERAAQTDQARRGATGGTGSRRASGSGNGSSSGGSSSSSGSGGSSSGGRGSGSKSPGSARGVSASAGGAKPGSGTSKSGSSSKPAGQRSGSSGGRNAGSRKKRRKR